MMSSLYKLLLLTVFFSVFLMNKLVHFGKTANDIYLITKKYSSTKSATV